MCATKHEASAKKGVSCEAERWMGGDVAAPSIPCCPTGAPLRVAPASAYHPPVLPALLEIWVSFKIPGRTGEVCGE